MKIRRETSVVARILRVFIALSCAMAVQAGTIDNKDIHVVDYEDMYFPALAFMARIQGVVVVQVKLDNQGKVTDSEALSGPAFLTQGSAENARKWKFEPNSEKAAIIVYSFRIEGDCHPASNGGFTSQMIFFPPNFAKITACASPITATSTSKERRRN